jgi:serine/threonine protein kinase
MTVETRRSEAALSRLASEVIREHPLSEEFCAETLLATNAALATAQRSIIKIAFEEYCRRFDNEEEIDVEAFVGRFPEVASILREDIEAHARVVNEPEKYLAPKWPVPDSRFLDWRLRRLIGNGGFSRVYLANESKVGNRPVALKLTTRTGYECDFVGKLHHPGICQILSVRDDGPGGLTAIAMPYHGEATLHDLIDHVWRGEQTRVTCELPDWGQPTSEEFVENVARMGLRLCDALEYAHGQNVLHCDLKPSNVLIKPDGSPLLLDFNLALSATSDSRAMGGTMGYMAPEQIEALRRNGPHNIDVRADVFGLGAILYHVLSGSPAFQMASETTQHERKTTKQAAIISAPPVPLMTRNRAVSAVISELVQSCLASDPAMRPQTIGEVRQVLARCVPRESSTPQRRSSRRQQIIAWATAAGALLAAAVMHLSGQETLDLEQEIARLEAIPESVITPADRELLGYYYCLDEKWAKARQVLQGLIDQGFESAAIHHNVAFCRIKLAEDPLAYLGFLDAIAIDSSIGPSWMALTYYDAVQAVNENRLPYREYVRHAVECNKDEEMLDLLTRYVRSVEEFTLDHGAAQAENPEELNSPSFTAMQDLSSSLHELPLTHWLAAPSSLSEERVNSYVAAN